MPIDDEQKEGLVLSIWQAITLVGNLRERSEEIEPSELEIILGEAESLLISAVSEAAQRPTGPRRKRFGLKFWIARDATSSCVSCVPSTTVVPFPRTTKSTAATHLNFDERATTDQIPVQLRRPVARAVAAALAMQAGYPFFQRHGRRFDRTSRLLLFVVLAILPMLATQVWHQRDLRIEREGVIRELVFYRVQELAAEVGELREGARQLLLAVAQLEPVKLRQPETCSALLRKLRSRYPNYSLLGAADSEGRVFCSSGPTTASIAGQSFFTRALAHDQMVVGNYWVDPVSGQKTINFVQQFNDDSGHIMGVAFAGLDLVWLSDHLKERGFTSNTSKLIADNEGTIIARVPSPTEFVGQNIRGSHERIMGGGEPGWEEVTGVDGVKRIFAYVPSSSSPKDFFLSIGQSKEGTFAAVRSAELRDAALILAGLVASIFVAWAGRNLVFRPGQGIPHGLWQLSVGPTQSMYKLRTRLAYGFALTLTSLAHRVSLIVQHGLSRSLADRQIMPSEIVVRTTYSVRAPPF
jgi:hypothetical protein